MTDISRKSKSCFQFNVVAYNYSIKNTISPFSMTLCGCVLAKHTVWLEQVWNCSECQAG